ncbi:MAG: alcohol dehydrogenase catalytic domain-containing protein, partial [Lachnospiraceae bacterium]|nr:alcohol dehydrogenase catalytic domain-containing protein [Lachnospiraceae bacterium]
MDKNYTIVFPEKCCVEFREDIMPQPGANQVLIKTEITQISTGTELTMLEANVDPDSRWNNSLKFPVVPGYTNIGRIVQVGEGVDESYLGKRVLTGAPHTKYAVRTLNEEIIFIPDDVESEEAIFSQLSAVCMASIRVSDIRPGDTVAVFGAGLIGQLTARLAKIAGSLNIFVTDVSDYRLSMLPDNPCFIPVNTIKEDILDALDH